MDYPQPPGDPELKNIIDKLAQFVARNGYEFEQMTKEKQRNNPRFAFLYGGEYFNYYQFRLSNERMFVQNQHQNQQMHPAHMMQAHALRPGPMGQMMPHLQQQHHMPQMSPAHFGPMQHMPHHPANHMVNHPGNHPGNHPNNHHGHHNNHHSNHPGNQFNRQSGGVPSSHQRFPSRSVSPFSPNQNQFRMGQPPQMSRMPAHPASSNILFPVPFGIPNPSHPANNGNMNAMANHALNQINNLNHLNHPMGTAHAHMPPNAMPMMPTSHPLPGNANMPLAGNVRDMYGGPPSHVQPPPAPVVAQPNPAQVIADLQKEMEDLETQMQTSESNLAAQQDACDKRRQAAIQQTLDQVQKDTLLQQAYQQALDLDDFDGVLQPILNSCTKDAISAGKGWISNKCCSSEQYRVICEFLLHKITCADLKFEQKLHILYLINDLFSHSIRKKIDNLKEALNRAIVAIYAVTYVQCEQDQQARLIKLQKLWETNNYLEADVLRKLKNPEKTCEEYQKHLQQEHEDLLGPVTEPIDSELRTLEQQHTDYTEHQKHKLSQLQKQIDALKYAQAPLASKYQQSGRADDDASGQYYKDNATNTGTGASVGANSAPVRPDVPYFDLPAGLMVPLVKMDDFEYNPLDPKNIRLPAPVPPNERLLRAVEEFYAPPSHDRPRNADGWEQLSLYEFFRSKSHAKRQAEHKNNGENSSSRRHYPRERCYSDASDQSYGSRSASPTKS